MRQEVGKIIDGVSKPAILGITAKKLLIQRIRILQRRPHILRIRPIPPNIAMQLLALLALPIMEAPQDLHIGIVPRAHKRFPGDELPDLDGDGVGAQRDDAADEVGAGDQGARLGEGVGGCRVAQHVHEVGIGEGREDFYGDGAGCWGGEGAGLEGEGFGAVFEDEGFHFFGEGHFEDLVIASLKMVI